MVPNQHKLRDYFPPAAAAAALCVLLAVAIQFARKGGSLGREEKVRARRVSCVNNLKQIELALHQWSLDHDKHLPFHLSTNAGGTLEHCARDATGFDRNSALHFQVLSNELVTPPVLVCPSDSSEKKATDFAVLRPENVSYRLITGTNVALSDPKAVLVVCPIDGNRLYGDGRVEAARSQDSD